MTLTVRAAQAEDVPHIRTIYNQAILNSVASWRYEPLTLQAQQDWFEDKRQHGYPVLVAQEAAQIVGWASLGAFRQGIGYQHTVENSVYVAEGQCGKGVGQALLSELICAARQTGYHTIVAGMEASNTASVRLHARFGFVQVAYFRQVGYKFGRWLDLIFMQLMLESG